MNRHAYMIIAHHQFQLLQMLCQLLDDERNDIYIMIDKKVKNFDESIIIKSVQHSKVFFTDRIKIQWGGKSIVNAEIMLLKAASKNKYSYYHLLSGADLPIKTADTIYNFFELNNGKEFIHFCNDGFIKKQSALRAGQYHFFQDKIGPNKHIFLYKLERISLFAQRKLNIDRLKKMPQICCGSQWFSITHEFARYVLEHEKDIDKMFNYTACADEMFMQTLLLHSPYLKNRYQTEDESSYISCMRYICWYENLHPYTWKSKDFDLLINSDFLFARKFDLNTDKDICKKIYEYLKFKMK